MNSAVRRLAAVAVACVALALGIVAGAGAHDYGTYKGHAAGSCGGSNHRQCIYQASRNVSSGHQHYYQHDVRAWADHYRWQGGVN